MILERMRLFLPRYTRKLLTVELGDERYQLPISTEVTLAERSSANLPIRRVTT